MSNAKAIDLIEQGLRILKQGKPDPIPPVQHDNEAIREATLGSPEFVRILQHTTPPPYAATDFYDSIYAMDALANAFVCTHDEAYMAAAFDNITTQILNTDVETRVNMPESGGDHCRPQTDLGASLDLYDGWSAPYFLDELHWAIGALKVCWVARREQSTYADTATESAEWIVANVIEKYFTAPGLQHAGMGDLVRSAVERKKRTDYRASGYWNDKITLSMLLLAFGEQFVSREYMPWRHWLMEWLDKILEIRNGRAHWDEGNPHIAHNHPREHRAYDTGHARREPLMLFHLAWLGTGDQHIDQKVAEALRACAETMDQLILTIDATIGGRTVPGVHVTNYIDGNDSAFRGRKDANGNVEGIGSGVAYGGWDYTAAVGTAAGQSVRTKLRQLVSQVQDGTGQPSHPHYSGSQAYNSSAYALASFETSLQLTERIRIA